MRAAWPFCRPMSESWGPMAHYSNCGKCGTYGHDAKLCPTQVNAVQPENNGAPIAKDTSDNACMDVGGGSFYFGIDCVETETSNMFSDLSEDDGNSSWTDWRGYYKSTPAPNIRTGITDEQASEAFNQNELAPDDEFEWTKVRKVVKDRKPVIGKPVSGKPVIGIGHWYKPVIGTNSDCKSSVNDMNSTCINLHVTTNSTCMNSPETGMNSNCIAPVNGVCGAGKIVRDLEQPVSGNIGIIGISDEPPKEDSTRDICDSEAIPPEGAPWVNSSNGRRIV